MKIKIVVFIILILCCILLLGKIYFNSLFEPIQSNSAFKVDKFYYRFINIYQNRESKTFEIFCYLNGVDHMTKSELIRFIVKINRRQEYDSSFRMRDTYKFLDQIFNTENKYYFNFINKNIIDENDKHTFSKKVLIDRRNTKICIYLSEEPFTIPDTCILF